MAEHTVPGAGQRRPGEPLPENSGFLVLLAVPPTIWMAHFLVSYVTAAVWCARFAGDADSTDPVRVAIGWYTAVALVAIGLAGWSGFRRHRYPGGEVPHDSDSPEDRHRFLGFATLLLAGLSAVVTVFVAAAPQFFATCD
jgi:hypothetical protein